ncbi:hypothetical protein IYR97_24470 (plasmid) [Pseudomonas fulva]|jgi:hypothetical protein|uniref:Uncharacterized protein n=2 Tax=Pseudomonas putida group TaxID=136845 RepID=A0ABD7BN90_PSEPU|nr:MULTISPECIES: hypothetical protein [Pseudomonas]MCT8162686.1 hypothetical protein [Pseudomonas sp. HD6422]MCT8181545.1 hypothetical protein [Pseudomonas sp. HD6421]MDH1932425.1 hypothetical protein [Pseudomonas sp. GD03696]QIZ22759.1 Hypothetical protein [Pseudomonas putida]QOD01162.1 hypothetical protein ID616_31660 [Pseudomonas putida]
MKFSALALAVVGAFGLVPDALSHELAFSKKDQVMVEVPGTADTWCKQDIELTISRPTWDNQQTLERLVSVLPVVLGKDCPAAKVTWKAVDASGKPYASGFGNAANLGIVSLAQPQLRQDGPTTALSSAASTVVPGAEAGTQTPAGTAGSTAGMNSPKAEATTQSVATEPVPARAQDELAAVTGDTIPAAVVEAVATDGDRSVVLSNTQLAQVEDGEERAQEARRQMERMANLHTRVLARYEQLKASLNDTSGHESEALAQLAGIRARFSSPLAMMDPGSSMRASPMMVHVTGHEGDYYQIDFPGPGRLQSDRKLGNEWYVLQAANLTPVAPLVGGKAVPTFKIYLAEEPEPCKQASCAERVSFGAVLGREFPDAGIDFSWTPEVSQQHLNAWKNASAQIQ